MQIALISTQSGNPWGGSEALWAEMARVALGRGHRVAASICRWPKRAPVLEELRQQGMELHERPRGLRQRIQRRVEPALGVPSFAWLLRWQPDVVCFNLAGSFDFFSSHLWAIPGRLLVPRNIPYILLCQASGEQAARMLTGDRREVAARLYRQAARSVFLSHIEVAMVERQLAVRLENAATARNPVNLEAHEILPWPESDGVELACVGRLQVRHKGQDALLETLAEEPLGDTPWRLRLYGEGPSEAYLRRLARHYGLADRVEFVGKVADVRRIWESSHLLVMPSRIEGVPAAMVEAMLSGRPCVVTDVGGVREWLDEPATGFVAEAPTAHSLGKALRRAIAARAEWEMIGRAAHEKAAAMIDPAPGASLLEILESAVKTTVPRDTASAIPHHHSSDRGSSFRGDQGFREPSAEPQDRC